MKLRPGFTVIEIIIAIIVVVIGTILFISGQATIQASIRDTNRKTAINAMYYGLENSYYKQHAYYPQTIDSDVLPVIDPSLFKDPNGIEINQPKSTLHYQAIDCNLDGQCRSYKLEADLEREANYQKQSIHS